MVSLACSVSERDWLSSTTAPIRDAWTLTIDIWHPCALWIVCAMKWNEMNRVFAWFCVIERGLRVFECNLWAIGSVWCWNSWILIIKINVSDWVPSFPTSRGKKRATAAVQKTEKRWNLLIPCVSCCFFALCLRVIAYNAWFVIIAHLLCSSYIFSSDLWCAHPWLSSCWPCCWLWRQQHRYVNWLCVRVSFSVSVL